MTKTAIRHLYLSLVVGATISFMTIGFNEAAADDLQAGKVELNQYLTREVGTKSVVPDLDFHTDEGNYIAIFVDHENRTPAVFEWVPNGGGSQVRDARSVLEIATRLAPGDLKIPDSIRTAHTFKQSNDQVPPSPFRQPLREVDGLNVFESPPTNEIIDEIQVTSSAALVSTCSKTNANNFYEDYRPGAYSASEGVNDYTSAGGYSYPKAKREKDWQRFIQTNSNQQTPTKPGNVCWSPDYVRASAAHCTGNMQIVAHMCEHSIDTCRFGCGNSGSDIIDTYGPYTFSSGTATYQLYPQGYRAARVKLQAMNGTSDLAIWSGMVSHSQYGTISERCFY